MILIPFAALFMMLVGVLLWAGVVFDLFRAIGLRKHGVAARGRIIEVRTRTVMDTPVLTPFIRFQCIEAGTVEFESNGKCAPGDLGHEVDVLYLPSQPKKAETLEHVRTSSPFQIVKDMLWGALCFAFGAGIILGQVFLRRWLAGY